MIISQAAIVLHLQRLRRRKRGIAGNARQLRKEAFEIILAGIKNIPSEERERLKELIDSLSDKTLILEARTSEEEDGSIQLTLGWFA